MGVFVVDEIYVMDGNVLTSAGIASGIDAAIYLVSLLFGKRVAKSVSKRLEYSPRCEI